MTLSLEPAQGLDITVDYGDGTNEGFNDLVLGPQRKAAFEHALTIWTEKLDGTIPIRVRAEFDTNFPTTALASTFNTAAWANLPGFPEIGWGFVGSLASQLNGNNLPDANGNHFSIQFNEDYDLPPNNPPKWYYGIDGLVPGGRFDLVSTAIHEIAHGLGMDANLNLTTGQYLSAAPYYFIFYVLRRGTSNTFFDDMSTSERLAAISSGEVYFAGPNVIAANIPNPISPVPDPNNPPVNANGEAKLHAPNPPQLGSSISHWDAFHVANLRELLMAPAPSHPQTSIDYTKEALMDLGWTFQPEPQIQVAPATVNFDSTGVNAGQSAPKTITITNTGASNLRIFSVSVQNTVMGTGADQFQIMSGGGAATLMPLQSRDVEVVFDPNSISLKEADLQILSNDTREWIERARLKGFAFAGTASTAWVDFNFVGDEMGTEAAPFDMVAEGVGFVMAGGTVNLVPGTTAETITIDKEVTLVNVGAGARGTMQSVVRIGDQSAPDPGLAVPLDLEKSTTGFVSDPR